MATAKLKSIRNGHRTHVKKIIGEVDLLVAATEVNFDRLESKQKTLLEKLDVIKELDEEILEEITNDDEIAKEIEDTSGVIENIDESLVKIRNMLISKNLKNEVMIRCRLSPLVVLERYGYLN